MHDSHGIIDETTRVGNVPAPHCSHTSQGGAAFCMGGRSIAATQRNKVSYHVNYWEIIADNLRKAGWSLGRVLAVDSNGRTIWIADAHRDDGKRFVVRADEKLTAFLELEAAIGKRPKDR